jgi:glycosyltransferase involved in cell wall biosynthesis
MQVKVVLEHRFKVLPDGTAWTTFMFPYEFWTRYLKVFEKVVIIARGLPVQTVGSDDVPATGPGVTFHAIPHFHGPKEYILRLNSISQKIRHAYSPDAAYILRVSSQLGNLLERYLAKRRHPYGVEVVGDPWDVFSRGASRHPLRVFFRYKFYYQLRRQCRHAVASAYVTESALQVRYPPSRNAFTTNYSSVDLPDEAFVETPRTFVDHGGRSKVVCIGTLDSYYKGPDTLLHAVKACIENHRHDVALYWVGDGIFRPDIERLSKDLGLSGCVTFLGKLDRGRAVRAALDGADLFVLASRQEGLPRATIEAMARGLPCIGTRVGGFGELLPDECLVPVNDPSSLAKAMCSILADRSTMQRMGERNLAVAKKYSNTVLDKRRIEYFRELALRTREATHPNRPPPHT